MPNHRDTARHFPWDRVPTQQGWLYEAGAMALTAGYTTRATYTVPSGRKASVDAAYVALFTAAIGGIATYARGRIVRAGAAGILFVQVESGVQDAHAQANVGQAGWLLAGETLTYQDMCTAGAALLYSISGASVTECQE